MVSRRWLFTLTMCFSPTAYLSCAFSLLLLFFRAQQFLNLFVRVPLVPFIQTRLVPSWSLPDYCTLPVEGRVKKTPGPYQHFTRDLNARSARHVQLFFFLSLLFSSLSSSCGSLSHLNTGALYWNSKRRVWAIVLGRSCSPSPFSSLSDEKHLFFFLKSWQTCHIICLSSLVHPFIEAQQKKTKQNNGISVRNSRRRLSQKGCVQLDHNFCLWAGNLVWSLLRCFVFLHHLNATNI